MLNKSSHYKTQKSIFHETNKNSRNITMSTSHSIDNYQVIPTVQWTMMDSLRIPECG